MLPDMTDKVEEAFHVACTLQQEYVSKSLIHSQFPLTDDIFWDNYIVPFMKVFSIIPNRFIEPGKKCLDVGCGEGRMLLLLKALGLNCYGVDKDIGQGCNLKGVSLEFLIKDLFQEHEVDVSILDIENERFEYSDSYFDMVVFQEVIEHLHNSPKLVLDEIKRVLKPGGSLILSTPNIVSLKKRITLLKGDSIHWDLKGYYNYEFSIPPNCEYIGHTREFHLNELILMLEWAGFRIERAETVDKKPYFRARDLIARWASRRGTGLWLVLKHLLQQMRSDLGEVCLIVAKS